MRSWELKVEAVLLVLLLSSRCSMMITIVLIGFSDYFGFVC